MKKGRGIEQFSWTVQYSYPRFAGKSFDIIESGIGQIPVLRGDLALIHIRPLDSIGELDLIDEEIVFSFRGQPAYHIVVQVIWVSEVLAFFSIQRDFDDMRVIHALLCEVVPENMAQQIGFPAAPYPSDDFDLTVVHFGNQTVHTEVPIDLGHRSTFPPNFLDFLNNSAQRVNEIGETPHRQPRLPISLEGNDQN